MTALGRLAKIAVRAPRIPGDLGPSFRTRPNSAAPATTVSMDRFSGTTVIHLQEGATTAKDGDLSSSIVSSASVLPHQPSFSSPYMASVAD
jgi:hypothetical protein